MLVAWEDALVSEVFAALERIEAALFDLGYTRKDRTPEQRRLVRLAREKRVSGPRQGLWDNLEADMQKTLEEKGDA